MYTVAAQVDVARQFYQATVGADDKVNLLHSIGQMPFENLSLT